MFGLTIFALFTFFILYSVRKKLSPELRVIFSKYLIFTFLLGALSILLYTTDNLLIYNQIDMEGDAQYYYYGAKEYLETGEINVLYPYYIKFISQFLMYGNAVTVRYAHLLIFMLIYAFGGLILNDYGISKNGFRYYSIFTCLNGAFYCTLTHTIRDIFILFHFVVAFFFISRLFLLYDKRELTFRKLMLYSGLLSFVGYGIYDLQLPSIFLFAVVVCFTVWAILLEKGFHRKMYLIFFALSFYFLCQ